MVRDLLQRRPEAVRRHPHHHHVGAGDGLGRGRRWPAGRGAGRSPRGTGCCVCSALISSATSASRAQSTVWTLCASRWATVVPHEPAPMTVRPICMRLTLGRRRRTSRRRLPRREQCCGAAAGQGLPRTPRCASLPRSTRRPGRARPRRWPPGWCEAASPLPVSVVCDDDEVGRVGGVGRGRGDLAAGPGPQRRGRRRRRRARRRSGHDR